MVTGVVAGLVFLGLFPVSAAALMQTRELTEADLERLGQARAIRVEGDSSTWRSRGRVSFAVMPSVRAKLRAAGFTVVQSEGEPHDLTLKVAYREERGRQFRADLYETDIRCAISLTHPTLGVLLLVRIEESSNDEGLTNAPYVDVLHKVESNPYFYFLGDLIKGFLATRRDAGATLIAGAERLGDDEDLRQYPHVDTAAETGDMLSGPELLYGAQALARTARELGVLREARAVPVLAKLLEHPDYRVRLSAATALGQLQSPAARTSLERAAAHDRDRTVRAAAAEALSRLPAHTLAP
ncbi:HEAT repeat domain-containing protein [Nitrospira sp. Kam-Ns4a]